VPIQKVVLLPLKISLAVPTHATATAMHFPTNAGFIFLTDELPNEKFLVDTGATLSIIPCSSNNNPSGPLLKGNQSPLGVSSLKLSSYKAKCSLLAFASSCSQSHSGHQFFCENSKSLLLKKPARSCLHVQQRPRQTFFAQFSAATPAPLVPPDSSSPLALPV
jgi:hypothetical protein